MTCKHRSKEGHDETHCWKLHPEFKPKKPNNKGKQKTAATKITTMGFKNMKGK